MGRREVASAGLGPLLSSKEMVVVCGSGGTGKTTVAAALGVAAARHLGARVMVLTVDPARRLATALGEGALRAAPDHAAAGGTSTAMAGAGVQVDLGAFGGPRRRSARGGSSPQGELWVTMLDTKAGWDDLVRRHAPDAALRERVLANPLYQNITGRFVHSHDYIAVERLLELHTSGRFDLVIIDTPPSRNALDLLDAPARMKEFFGSRLLRWLTVPARSRLFTTASKPFYQVADRVLGSRFLQDIAEFFVLFQSMEAGFVERADAVERLLVDPRTSFVVVSTLEAAPVYEARFLVGELERRSMHVGAIALNKALPATMRGTAAATAARRLVEQADDRAFVDEVARATDADPSTVAHVLTAVGTWFADAAVLAAREAERTAELAALGATTVVLPALGDDVTDVGALAVLGDALVGPLAGGRSDLR